MKYVLLFSVILFSILAAAQDCTNDFVLQKPGAWKTGMKGSEEGTAADLAAEKKIVLAIHTMIKSKYTPMSVEAIFHGAYSSPSVDMQVNGYSYSIIPLNYYCDGNTIKTEHETSTYFQISANFFDAEIYDTAQGDRLLGEGFNVMYNMPVEKNGYWFFKEIDAGLGMGRKGKSSAWLITYDGKLPFSYVTKKEFLEKRKKALQNLRLISASGFVDVLKGIEIEKKYKEAEYKNDAAKLQRYMKMDYLPVKENYEKLLANNDKNYKPAFDKIEAQLKLPADELNQQAIVKNDPNDYLSYLFTDDNDGFGKILIKPNPGYFNRKLPRSTPQFFWVYVRANHKEPIATRFMADIMKAVDFAKLKTMLGK
jgi:hypothetical protein